MRAEPTDKSRDAKHRKHGAAHAAKPKRTTHAGPIGFHGVLHDVAGASTKQAKDDARHHEAALSDPSTQVLLAMGAVPSIEHLMQHADSTGLTTAGTASASTAAAAGSNAAASTTNLGQMTPGALLTRVLDEASKLEIEHASKTLHVELEPAHLGPLVVSLKREPNGALDIRFRAKRGDAARVLESGSDMLRDRLTDAGFTTKSIVIEHDADA